jgi:Zn-dependent peptidase ImmA (M78 family)
MRKWRSLVAKKVSKAEIFISKFNFWCTKILGRTFPTKKDYRYNCHACCEFEKNKDTILVYNPRKIARWSEEIYTLGMFHEIGHLIFYDYKKVETQEEEIEEEYLAELFALRMVKLHHPEIFEETVKQSIKAIGRNKFKKDFAIHYKAFGKIKEYAPAYKNK